MTEKKIEKGDIIYREGDLPDFAYTILSGKVELYETVQNREVQIRVVEAGKTLGEYALFDPQALRPFSARALEPTVLDALSSEEFDALIEKTPKSIVNFLRMGFEKMRVTRMKEKTEVAGVPSTDIGKIVISPKSENLKEKIKAMEVPVSNLPFRIGGYPEGGEASTRDQVHLSVAATANPLLVSRQHCEIVVENGSLMIGDLGSRFCTTVNGETIGRGRGRYYAPLKKGANEVILGPLTGAYRLNVKCE